jgi:hypothetical protein
MAPCEHERISWISIDTMPPIVTGVCMDCGKGFPDSEEEPTDAAPRS